MHCIFITLFVTLLPIVRTAEYVITTSWNNNSLPQSEHVTLSFMKNDEVSFKVEIHAPFYNDPPPSPNGAVGEPLFGLWDFELVKMFFLNELHEYIEIELGAWGHHFVLLCNGYRHTVQFGMLIKYNAFRNVTHWSGTAVIPTDYLPFNVTKMNAYSYHGLKGSSRTVNALYPVTNKHAELDDHVFEAYRPFDQHVLTERLNAEMSSTWTDALEGIRSFQITHQWKGEKLQSSEFIDLQFQVDDSKKYLILNVSVPFYKDPPPQQSVGPYTDLYKHEVFHLYLLSYPDFKYVEIELGPWGHYLVVFWNGYYNLVGKRDSPLNYTVNRNDTHWKGTAAIPLSYLPRKVYLMNAHSSHGTGSLRKWNSLYPAPPETNKTIPDFHNFKYYKFVDFTMIYPDNESPECPETWQSFNVCNKSSAAPSPVGSITIIVLSILVLIVFKF